MFFAFFLLSMEHRKKAIKKAIKNAHFCVISLFLIFL
jgi:hypothetical protein